MNQISSSNIRKMVFTSLFTALIIVGGYISFPLPFSPIPIVLADFFVMLAGLLLGASSGGAGVGLFLFLGALGIPVFAGGKGGLAVLFGPTGGFLFGYLVCATVIGIISRKGKPSVIKDLVALAVGNLALYSIGVSWLKLISKLTWGKALALGLFPFVIGIIIKIIVILLLNKALRAFLRQALDNSSPRVVD
jgi:biotin transport system substrate-specific component